MKKKSLVKENELIREALLMRKEELGLTLIDICRDAEQRGVKILHPSLSRYFNRSKVNNLPEEAILFLCARYDVPVELYVGHPSTYVSYKIGPYNERAAKANLDIKFKNNGVHKRRPK